MRTSGFLYQESNHSQNRLSSCPASEGWNLPLPYLLIRYSLKGLSNVLGCYMHALQTYDRTTLGQSDSSIDDDGSSPKRMHLRQLLGCKLFWGSLVFLEVIRYLKFFLRKNYDTTLDRKEHYSLTKSQRMRWERELFR